MYRKCFKAPLYDFYVIFLYFFGYYKRFDFKLQLDYPKLDNIKILKTNLKISEIIFIPNPPLKFFGFQDFPKIRKTFRWS